MNATEGSFFNPRLNHRHRAEWNSPEQFPGREDSQAADIEQSVQKPTGNLWRALYHFNLYRLFLSGALLTLSFAVVNNSTIGQRSPTLFLIASLGLAATSLINILAINAGRPGFRVQATWQVTSDIAFITLLMHASGGIDSGFGFLLLVSIAGGGVILPGMLNLGFAALATMSVMAEAFIRHLVDGRFATLQPLQLAVLGVACFATAIAMSFVSARVRRIETLAADRARELRMLTHANAHIVQQLDTGIVLIGDEGRILLTNEKSRDMLGYSKVAQHLSLSAVSPQLAALVAAWRSGAPNPLPAQPLYSDGPSVIPRIVTGPSGADGGLVIMLEDEGSREIRAQEIKLAALGRLSAAISHEIRNPLAAISHASELLAEADHRDAGDQRLVEIIQTHSARINNIIQSVLHLGRRDRISVRNVALLQWAQEQVAELQTTSGLDDRDICVNGTETTVSVNSDQLMQIIGNLCENALRANHQVDAAEREPVSVLVGVSEAGRSFIDIVDGGPGVAEDKIPLLFEPFFTTEASGTGLGLYISRELAAVNGASLNYIHSEQPGARFRVEFSGAES